MTRRKRPCPLPRSYGACGEPTSFAAFGAAVLERIAIKEARAQALRDMRENHERAMYRELRERHQRSQGWDANGSPVAEIPAPPHRSRRERHALPTILALASMLSVGGRR